MIRKLLAFLLLFPLILTGCQNTQPTDAPQEPSVSDSSDAGAQPRPVPIGGVSSSSEQSSREDTAPMPEGLPSTTPEAIALPEKLFSSTAGYGIELITPAQYSVYQKASRDDFTGFQTAEYFELKSKEGEKFALANENGKIITPFVYDDDGKGWFFQDGNSGVALSKDGKYGVVDGRTGEELLPFQYDSVQPQRNDTFICETGDTYELLDRSGKVLLTYSRGDQLTVFPENVMLFENGMLRFYDKQTRPVKNFACEEVRPSVAANLILVKSSGKWGICEPDGQYRIEPQFAELDQFNEQCEAAVFTKNGKKGVLDLNGDVLIKPQWDDVELYDSSASVEKNGKWGAFTDLSDSEPAIEPMYDYVYAFGTDGYAAYEHRGKFGILDEEGNILISARYDRMVSNHDGTLEKGYYALEGDGKSLYGIVSGKGELVVPDTYTIVFSDGKSEEPYHRIMTQREKWGYIDRAGQMVIDTRFDSAGQFLKGKDVAFVKIDGKICLIDRKGNVVMETVFSDLVSYHPETFVGAFTYTNAQGKSKCCLAKLQFPT